MIFKFVKKENDNYLLKSKLGPEILLTKKEFDSLSTKHGVKILNLSKIS